MNENLSKEIKHIDIDVINIRDGFYQADIIYKCREEKYKDYQICITFITKLLSENDKYIVQVETSETRVENTVQNKGLLEEFSSNIKEQIEIQPLTWTVYDREGSIKHTLLESSILLEKLRKGYRGLELLYSQLQWKRK